MSVRILLVDLHFVLSSISRFKPDSNRSEVFEVSAKSILKSIRTNQPTHILVCLDDSVKSWRKNLNPNYKRGEFTINHRDLPDLSKMIRLLKGEGVATKMAHGCESIDVIASLCEKLSSSEAGSSVNVTIHSGDKRLYPLINQNISLYNPYSRSSGTIRKTKAWLDSQEMKLNSWPDYFSLLGDKERGLHGIPGAGKKKAKTLIDEYESIEVISSESVSIDGKLGKTIRDNIHIVCQYEKPCLIPKYNLVLGFSLSDIKAT